MGVLGRIAIAGLHIASSLRRYSFRTLRREHGVRFDIVGSALARRPPKVVDEMTDASGTVVDGLTNFAEFMQDINFGVAGAAQYRALKSAIEEAMTPSDVCVLAFSTILLDQNTRPSALVVILQDRVIAAWKRGAFRKTLMREVIRFSSITSVQRVTGDGALRAANLMRIDGSSTVTIALPIGPKDVYGLVTGALQPT